MEKVAQNSKFVGHSNEIIQQSKIRGPLKENIISLELLVYANLKTSLEGDGSVYKNLLILSVWHGTGHGLKKR